MPDCVSLVGYWTCSSIPISLAFFQSGIGLKGCWTVRHFYIYVHGHRHGHAALLFDMDMQHGHGHAVQSWTYSVDMETQHGFNHKAWILTMDMHGCLMPIKSSVRHHQFSVSLQRLVRHQHSPASWSVRYHQSRISPVVSTYGYKTQVKIYFINSLVMVSLRR